MKKILFLLLLTVSSYGQTLQNPTYGNTTTNTLKIKTPATVSTVNFLSTNEADGSVSKIAPINVNIPYTPINYSAPTQTIGNHLLGIDTRLGQISSTSAGLTQRVWFTADNTTVTAGTFFASNPLGKGATATGSPPALVLGDNVKAYFNKDLISGAQPSATIGYAGTYSGNLTVSATPTPNATQQRFTLEVYRCNNGGTPIASGVSGAPTGDLGVTVVAILDSGLVNLVAGSISNVSISGTLTQNITINTGERLRYHVSAQKVGVGGGNVTFGVYYGTSYNSYYDVPVAITTDAVLNKSTVTGITATDALNNLKGAIPTNYAKIVYVNNVNPNSATIFALENPPLVNDNALKANTNYLYVGSDSSGWVYNSFTLTYTVKPATVSNVSNFYTAGTTIDATGDKTGPIERPGTTFYSDLRLKTQPVGSSANTLSQTIGTTGYDFWKIYGEASVADRGIMVFEVGDNGQYLASDGQKFEFRYNASDSGIAKTPLSIDYDLITANAKIGATNYSFTMGSLGAVGVVSNSSSFGAISGSVGYGLSTNESFGGLDIMANQVGQPIRFWSGTDNTAPTKRLELGTSGVKIPSLAGTGTRTVVADASGNLSSGGIISSGSYTPTVTASTNITSATLSAATFERSGDIVSGTVSINTQATSINSLSEITITVPINRAGTISNHYVGTGTYLTNISFGAGNCFFSGNSTNTITLRFNSGISVAAAGSCVFNFRYDITK